MEITKLEEEQETLTSQIKEKMLVIPQIMDPSVPIGKDDSENVEVQRFGEALMDVYDLNESQHVF